MTNGGGDARAPLSALALVGLAAVVALVPALGVGRALLDGAPDPGGAWRAAASPAAEAARLAKTFGVAALIGTLAAALGAAPAWACRSLPARWTALALCPMLLPSYAAASAWGLLRAPGTPLAAWIAEDARTRAPAAALIQAVVGLALWSWPLAAVVMRGAALSLDPSSLDAARLHGGRIGALRVTARRMAPSFLAGAGLVGVVMLGSAVPLHVAQIETSAIAVWRRLDETAGSRSAWVAALPLLALTLALGAVASALLIRPLREGASARVSPVSGRARSGRGVAIVALLVWAASTIIPLALYLTHLREFRTLPAVAESLAPALGRSAVVAGLVGLGSAALAAGFSYAGSARRGRGAALLSGAVWTTMALAPGVLIGAAIARAGTWPALRFLGDTGAGVTLAHLARFGAVGALTGLLLARMEPRDLADLRALEPRPLMAWLRGAAPLQAGAILGAGLAAAALSLQEIEATVMLAAPGSQSLAQRMLGMLHYLRVEELNAAAALVMGLALALALGAGLLASVSAAHLRRLASGAGAALVVMALIGCERAPSNEPQDLELTAMFGEVGGQPGQFVYPRCIDADDSTLWVIDKRGQVQRLATDGEPLASWIMPDISLGFPVGVTVDPSLPDTIYIADTHQHRVMMYRVENGEPTLVRQWGSYGQEPGQFIYLTDVAVVPMPDGSRRFYVSEYGGNDRVSCFDEEANYLFAFGEGEGSSAAPERIQFARPQSILWHPGLGRLIVADAGNHRLGVFTLDGQLERWIGRVDPALGPMPDDGMGGFNYPYGLALLDGGDVLVSEFGASRVQRIDPATGERRGVWGRPGREPGRLACPWGVAAIGDTAYVLDSMNHRVAAFRPTPVRGAAQRP